MNNRTNAKKFSYPENIIADLYESRTDVEKVKNAFYENKDAVKERLEKMISFLSEREQAIIRYRYVDQLTIREISEKFGITVSRVQQIRLKSMRRLRHPKKSNYIIFGSETIEKSPSIDSEIYVLGLSDRAFNCLRRANINTVRQASQLSDDDYIRIRNMGRRTMEEVKTKTQEFIEKLESKKYLADNGADIDAMKAAIEKYSK